jgi:hypothetical protein
MYELVELSDQSFKLDYLLSTEDDEKFVPQNYDVPMSDGSIQLGR